jgi:hypothetical protein
MSGPKKLALVGGGAAVLALGIAIPAVAFADPTPTPSSSTSADPGTREDRRAEHRDRLAAALAKELGIDQAKVAAALDKVDEQMRADAKVERQTALKARLAAAVSEGKLTQAEADAILKASEAGVLGGPDGLGHPGRPGPGRGGR